HEPWSQADACLSIDGELVDDVPHTRYSALCVGSTESPCQTCAVASIAAADQPTETVANRLPQPRFVSDHRGIVVLDEDPHRPVGRRSVVAFLYFLAGDAGRRLEAHLAQPAGQNELSLFEIRFEPFGHQGSTTERRAVSVGILTVTAVGALSDSDQVDRPVVAHFEAGHRAAAIDVRAVNVPLLQQRLVNVAALPLGIDREAHRR